ncbi:MAG: c-type cytochrome [Nitrospinales bacterium]
MLPSEKLFFLAAAVCSILVLGASDAFADAETGKRLFKEKNCYLCHDVTLPGAEFKPVGPGLKNVRKRHRREWLSRWLKNPAAVWKSGGADIRDINARYFKYRNAKPRPRDSFMATVIGKTIILSADEIEHLVDYLLTL